MFRVEQWLGSPSSGSLLIALAATVATVVVVLCSRVPRVATVAALTLAFSLCVGFSAAAAIFDLEEHELGAQILFRQ